MRLTLIARRRARAIKYRFYCFCESFNRPKSNESVRAEIIFKYLSHDDDRYDYKRDGFSLKTRQQRQVTPEV